MKKSRLVLFSTLLLMSMFAMADEKSDRLEKVKEKIAHHVETEINILTKFRECVLAVKTKEDFEKCRVTKNDAQAKIRADMKKDRLDNQKNL
jgi:hypothetical protein